MEQPKRPRGRPPGGPYVGRWTNFRLSDDERARLDRLAAHWGCSRSDVLRRLLAEAAAREGVE